MYSVQTPDDGQRKDPKHVEFHVENKFVKLVRLVGFIIKENPIITLSKRIYNFFS